MGLFSADVTEFDTLEQDAALCTDAGEKIALYHRLIDLYCGDISTDLDFPEVDELRTQYRTATVNSCNKIIDLREQQGESTRAHEYRSRSAAINSRE